MRRRVLVIGLDCAPPALVFDRLRDAMPNVAGLMRRGAHGPLRTVAPPITVPAWACMVSGRDPGELGLYGFRNRADDGYALSIADATWLDAPRVWDVLGDAEKTVATLYVPLTSPPRAVNGCAIGGFLGRGAAFTHPPELGARLEARFGPHAPDVSAFRTGDTERLLDELYDTTRQHFRVAEAIWTEDAPDFLMMVEMGTDRLHHALWRHLDPAHPDHDPDHPHVRDARDYYAFVDAQIGALLERTDDDTAVLVVSDHGARSMRGGVCVNEHLRRAGWLALKDDPPAPTALTPAMVDWSRTRAWGEGGYYARIFFNVAGREPEGIVHPDRLDAEVRALAAELEVLPLPTTERPTRAARPVDLYRAVRGRAPELLVFFGDLDVRSLGKVGGEVFQLEDDRGPDGCNHDWDGIFVAAGAGVGARGRLDGLSIHDVGPTVLSLLGVPTPDGWLGVDRSAG